MTNAQLEKAFPNMTPELRTAARNLRNRIKRGAEPKYMLAGEWNHIKRQVRKSKRHSVVITRTNELGKEITTRLDGYKSGIHFLLVSTLHSVVNLLKEQTKQKTETGLDKLKRLVTKG